MKKNLTLLLIYIFICSCSLLGIDTHNNVLITVERLNNGNEWSISYQLPRPVYGLVFKRQTNQFRKANWKIQNSNLMIVTNDGNEVIVSKDNRPFDRLSITHKSYFKTLEKDYNFFIKFSGNDILQYVGHYSVLPLFEKNQKITDKLWDNSAKNEVFNFITNDNNVNIIVDGIVSNYKTSWKNISGRGTYVFWGTNKPNEYKELTLLVDSEVPAWVKKGVLEKLPKIFDFYEQKLGLSLNFKPVVYLNYEDRLGKNLGNNGGTLPGIVQLTLKGKDWIKEDQGNIEWLFWFLAHESAHLWNTQLVNTIRGKHSWLHEGGADAFAYKALNEFKIISDERYLKFIRFEKKKCIKGLKGGFALSDSANKRKFRNYYSCGAMIAYITEKNINRDLFSFWKTLLNQEKQNDGIYDDKDYFLLWEKESSDHDTINEVKHLIYNSSKGVENLFSKYVK